MTKFYDAYSDAYLVLYKKWQFFYLFFWQNFSKILSKTHQIAPFLKIFSGEHAPEPPSKLVVSPRAAWREIPPLFQKNFEPPPPEMKP